MRSNLQLLEALLEQLADLLREFDGIAVDLAAKQVVAKSYSGVEILRDSPGPAIAAYVDAVLTDGEGFGWKITIEVDRRAWHLLAEHTRSDVQGGYPEATLLAREGVDLDDLLETLRTAGHTLTQAVIDKSRAWM